MRNLAIESSDATVTKLAFVLLCDNRKPMPELTDPVVDKPEPLDWDSVVGLPLKRDLLRKFVRLQPVEVVGDVVIELERDSDMEYVVQHAVHHIWCTGARVALTSDGASLADCGLLQALRTRLQKLGIELRYV